MIIEVCNIKSKTFFMKSIKFVFLSATIFSFFVFSPALSFSQAAMENNVKTDVVNKVLFAGAEEDLLVFDVCLSGLPLKGSTLQIKDDAQNVIFEEFITGSSFTRRYKIAKDPIKKITFKAAGKGFSFNQSFTINIKIEEKLTVTSD